MDFPAGDGQVNTESVVLSGHEHGGNNLKTSSPRGGGDSSRRKSSGPSVAALQRQYISLYEKFQVLDEKYSLLKKAMGEVLWEILPKYTDDYNQLPPIDRDVDDSIIPGRLKGYEVLEKIGEGRFAQVRSCRAADLSRVQGEMCVKTIEKSMIKDARRGRRVHQEVAALRRLDHPNIIVLYDVIQTRDNIHIISERMERDLFEYIHRRPAISESETFVIIFQIIQAVMFCHTQGIAHRDLKPENVVINSKGKKTPLVKICDFGLSLEVQSTMVDVEMVGSPGFLPPEILVPGLYDPFRGDVWSIGCILLEMVTDADYFKQTWMKPYEHLNEPGLFEEKMLASLERLQDLRLKLTDGLCDTLFHMLSLDAPSRPYLQQIQEHPWIVTNARRHDFECDLPLVRVDDINSPGHADSPLSPSPPSPKAGGQTGFTDRLRSRVDAFSTKNFRFRFGANLAPIDTSMMVPVEAEDNQESHGQEGEESGSTTTANKAMSPKTPTVKKMWSTNGSKSMKVTTTTAAW